MLPLNLLHYQHLGPNKFEWTNLFTLNYALLFIWSFFPKQFKNKVFYNLLLKIFVFIPIYVTNVNIGHGHMMNEVHSHGFPSMIL
jgi:hypothetical protein